ncbi:hypothetical protein Tco_0330970 [Tanacetum coccineum]
MLNRHKNWLVHKQTACGKDFSNPFMVDNLPKIVGFSTHLASLVKSWLVQDQTVLGKDYSNLLIADSLLKTIWFINAPCYGNEALASPKANELTIPEQTATGKGTSNPFMADKYFVKYTGIEVKHFRDALLQHMESKIDTSKAVDDDLVFTESSGTESEVQDDNSRSGNDTDADDADIRPI